MSEEIKKPNPIKEAQIAAKKAAAELKLKRDDLKKNFGKKFSNDEGDCEVVGFQPDKMLGNTKGDAFLVNFGNPNRSDYIFCDEFLTNYKGKE